MGTVRPSALADRTCGFPASGSPTGFTVRHTKEITDRKRHLCGVLSVTRTSRSSATGSIDNPPGEFFLHS
jgi:hypothetical protein